MPDFLVRRLRELAFVGYILGVLIYSIPSQLPIFKNLTPPSYYHQLGLWQSWNMFSPIPAFESHRVEVQFEFFDGEEISYFLPNHLTPHFYRGEILERFRKWQSEALPNDQLADLRPRAVEYVARNAGIKTWKKARIIQHWQDVKKRIPKNLDDYENYHILYDSTTTPSN